MATYAVKVIVFLKKKPGTSREHFERYYDEKHAPLALTLVGSPMGKYTRNYLKSDPANAQHDLTCDGITEFWFRTEQDWKEFNELRASPEITKILDADEANFVDISNIRYSIVREVEDNSHLGT